MAHIHIHIHGATDDDWSPEARKAAAEARKGGAPAKRPPDQVEHRPAQGKPSSLQLNRVGNRVWYPAGSLGTGPSKGR